MLKRKLQILSALGNRQTQKRVDKISSMQKEASPVWKLISLFAKVFSLIFFGGLILFPFFFMISWALMSNQEVDPSLSVTNGTHFVPQDGLHWENFKLAFEQGYWRALLVTLFVTAASIALKLILTIMMGYAFSYKKWWGKKTIWYLMLAILMVPEIALVVGQYKLTVTLNLHVGAPTMIAMFLPFIAHIFSAFMFRNAFEAIPDRTKEAALIDGCSEFRYFIKVAIPMITPTIWTVVILTAFASWNSYMWPQLLNFGSTDKQTYHVLGTWLFTTGKVQLPGETTERLMSNVRMAASIIVALPMIIIYFLFRTRIMNAISKQGSAIKG